ncbi:ABC transporter permease subunit [Tessaracoccus coleopterorum]|uniref:ABC transporter permease subunit n=1 Tax=Tessaracoccus coleopterorum TaxID=2714950 RepID=UPI0018D4AB2A|nr:ABC transporter permease subunit [Tessaracoccus coleopterorum]
MEAVFANLDQYWAGFKVTLELLIVGGIGALLLGIVIALLRISPLASLRAVATGYTELVRNTPLTLVFFLIIVVLPTLDVRFNFMVGAYLSLAIYTSAFVAEAIRSGINGVPIGQAEAARSVGLTFGQTVGLIILPQAFRMTIPPLINVFIALTKNTSVAAGFYVVELVAVSKQLANENGNAVIPILMGIAACYLIITIPSARSPGHRAEGGGPAMSTLNVLYDAPGPRTRRLSRVLSIVLTIALAGLAFWFLWRLGQPRTTVNGAVLSGLWDPSRWDIFAEGDVWYSLLVRGLLMGTLRAAGIAAVLALILGVLLCFARSARSAWIRVPTTIVLEFFRACRCC